MKIQKYSSIQVFNVKARDPVAFINIWDYTSSALVLSDLNIIFECCVVCLPAAPDKNVRNASWQVLEASPTLLRCQQAGAQCRVSVVTLRCVVTSSPLLTSQSQYRIFITWDSDQCTVCYNDHCIVSHLFGCPLVVDILLALAIC